jgi:transcriptional regulator with XRE-family HTH domain/energy-coupling factor transporter ATP-binding protein EcfA2
MSIEEIIPNERLRRARDLKGWTQSDVAEALGTDSETISRWERGITIPSSYYRLRLCTALGKTAEELGLRADSDDPLLAATHPYVFLASSYANADHELVAHLKAHLHARGMSTLSSRTLRRQGVENQRKALQEAIRSAQAVLLIASPEARSSHHVQKALHIAGIYRSQVCAVWIDGENWQECVPKDCGEFFATIDARKHTDARVFDELVVTLEEIRLASNATAVSVTTTTESAEPPGEPRNPYKGLKAFGSEDRHDFFGRDTLINDLAETLSGSLIADEKQVQSARFLAVVGPSGSGKSSVVMAGLLPHLQAGGLPGSQQWVYLDPILPGAHPIDALALAFAQQLPDRSLKTIREDLEDDSAYGLHRLSSYLGKRVMLFVDQFEEVFTQTTSEEERRHFIDLLVTAATGLQGPTILILTLRADFYDRPMHYPELFQLIEAQHTFVLTMDLKGLREVIEKPAELPDVQLTFEGDLARDLLFEVQEQVGALPLLQFTLDQLFQRRSGHTLTLQAYHEIGGVKGAVAKHAESTYTALPLEEHRRLARALFLRLIDPGATEQDTTRRRAALSELLLPDEKQTTIMRESADAFIAARLLTTNEVAGTTTLEVSHEALIREWTRLADWLREAREDIRLQQTLSADAAEWQQRKQPADRLYRGSQLKDAQTWARRNTPSGNEVAFLHASAAQRMRSVVSVLVVLFLVVTSIATAGWFFTHQAPRLPDPTRVTNLADHGPGSLRQAIDTSPPGSTITFDAHLSGTIMLTSDLAIDKNLVIRGPVARTLAVSSGYSGYIVRMLGGVSVSISNLNFEHSSTMSERDLSGFISNTGTLTLTNSTVSGNFSIGTGGGGISNTGILTLSNSTVSGNIAIGGGGIANFHGTLTLNNSSVSGNTGGGILNNGGTLTLNNSSVSGNMTTDPNSEGAGISNTGILTLSNSTVSGNTASGGGGGIYNGNGTLTLSNSTISGNTTKFPGDGGGINNTGILTLSNSTVSGNIASGAGAGIANLHSGHMLSNSTISGNTTKFPGDGGGIYNSGSLTLSNSTVSGNTSYGGGGIFNDGHLTLTNSTVSGNSSNDRGGGIEIASPGQQGVSIPQYDSLTFGTIYGNIAPVGADLAINNVGSDQLIQVEVRNSIIAGDPAHPGPDISGMLTTCLYNLFQDNSGATFDPYTIKHNKTLSVNDLTALFADPVGLRDHGGPTRTYALGPDSPAADQVPLAACHLDGITTDQRGVKRPDGSEGACDSGAYESTD